MIILVIHVLPLDFEIKRILISHLIIICFYQADMINRNLIVIFKVLQN